MKTRVTALSYGIVVLLLAMLAFYLLSTNRKHRMRIIEEMARTEEVKEEIVELKRKQTGMNSAMAALFENRMKILQTLSDQYDLLEDKRQKKMKAEGRELFKDEIIALFKKNMKELRNDKDISMSMEGLLDDWKDGIMRKFKNVFGEDSPSGIRMSKEDFDLAPFFFSGMKQKTISYLTYHTEHSIKERKRRIKQKIVALGSTFSEEKQLFLNNL